MLPRFKHNDSFDINDFIVECDPVPSMWNKNRDKTLRMEEFVMILCDVYTKPEKDDVIKAYEDNITSQPFFVGIVLSIETLFGEDRYAVTIISELYKLQNLIVSHNPLHNQLVLTSDENEYQPSDNAGLPNVNVLYLIKSMFALAGLNLFVNTDLRDYTLKIIVDGISPALMQPFEMKIKHLHIDENVLYSLNQESAINWIVLTAILDRVALKISFFDFLSEFCSHFSAHIIPVDSADDIDYELKFSEDPDPSYQDDFIYGKSEEEQEGDDQGYAHNLRFAANRASYLSTVGVALTDHDEISGQGRNNIDTINNWVYMFRAHEDLGRTPGWVYGHDYPTYCYEAELYLQNKIKEATSEFLETNLVTDKNLSEGAVESYFDLGSETSENTWIQEE